LDQQSLEDNYCLDWSQSAYAILDGAWQEVYQLRNHKRNRNLPLLSPGIQDFVEHESVAYVQQPVRYVCMQGVDM
jgi:hypothetical protein